MKKILLISLLLCMLPCFIGCTDSDISSSVISGEDLLETVPVTEPTNSSNVLTKQELTDRIINTTNDKMFSDKFITSYDNFAEYNGWIYYVSGDNLTRCRKDFTEKTVIKENAYYFNIIDSILYYFVSSKNGQKDMYKIDLSDDNIESEKISHFSKDMAIKNPMVYGGYIVCSGTRIHDRISLFDLNGEKIKYIGMDEYSSFGMIDNYIFYCSKRENSIMRYDISKDELQTFYELTDNQNYTNIMYSQNCIIIQDDLNKFTYINIDNKNTNKITFDIDNDYFSLFDFSDDDYLYFSIYTPNEIKYIYGVKIGEDTPEYIMDITYNSTGLHIIDNNIYYKDFAGEIHKKELKREIKTESLPDYESYMADGYIKFIINDNPIDKTYEKDKPNGYTTEEMMDFSAKYTKLWQIEIDNALSILTDNLTDEALEALKSQQKSWEEYLSNSTPSNVYIQAYGYDAGMQIQDSAKYLLEVRQRAMELIEYCIMITDDYEYIFQNQSS